jgi:hypothetical protein
MALEHVKTRIRELLVEQTGEDVRFFTTREWDQVSSPLVDFCLHASIGNDRRIICVDVKTSPLRNIEEHASKAEHFRAHRAGDIYVLAIPDLSERAKRLLQSHRVNYIDYAGSIWIREPGLYVNVEAPNAKRPRSRRNIGKKNPFSKKASLVGRVFLQQPGRVWGVRAMSDEAGLSVGYTSEVIRELKARRYIEEEPDGHRLVAPLQLLRDWTEVYSWDDNDIYSFIVPASKEHVSQSIDQRLSATPNAHAFTLLTATDFVVPQVEHDQTQVYALKPLLPEVMAFIQDDLDGEPVRSGGNCHVLVPYYGKATFYGSRKINGMSCVSNEQLFLDLVHYPARGVEAAGVLARTALADQVALSQEDVRGLRSWLDA